MIILFCFVLTVLCKYPDGDGILMTQYRDNCCNGSYSQSFFFEDLCFRRPKWAPVEWDMYTYDKEKKKIAIHENAGWECKDGAAYVDEGECLKWLCASAVYTKDLDSTKKSELDYFVYIYYQNDSFKEPCDHKEAQLVEIVPHHYCWQDGKGHYQSLFCDTSSSSIKNKKEDDVVSVLYHTLEDCEKKEKVLSKEVISGKCGKDPRYLWGPYTNTWITCNKLCIGNPPPEWNCTVSKYNDSSICDCGCASQDPDCDPDLDFPTNCPSSSIGCNETNFECQYSSSPPAEWICSDEYWFDGVGCDCECGAYDADCDDSNLAIHGCASHVSYCSHDDGHCIYETPELPELWTCSKFVYNASDACDCNCGTYDPDCDDLELELLGCGPSGASCSITGHCIFNDTPPTEWICDDSWYGQDQWCDCGCGSYDPDCEDHSKTIFNCPNNNNDTFWCNYDGNCVLIADDPLFKWSCDEEDFDDGLICNCNCGMYDPDCDDPENKIIGCEKYAIGCNINNGTCVYKDNDFDDDDNPNIQPGSSNRMIHINSIFFICSFVVLFSFFFL